MRPAAQRILYILPALLFVAAFSAHAQLEPTFGPLPVFEFHSGFWVNLHHELYFEAKLRANKTAPAARSSTSAQNKVRTMADATTSLTPAENSAWEQAIQFYLQHFADKDLLFNNDLVLLKNQLSDFEGCDELSGAHKKTCDAGLPADLTQALDAAAPVYRAHLWADQDRANRRWVTRVAPLVEEQGVGCCGLEDDELADPEVSADGWSHPVESNGGAMRRIPDEEGRDVDRRRRDQQCDPRDAGDEHEVRRTRSHRMTRTRCSHAACCSTR